jgi:hypothetical protein
MTSTQYATPNMTLNTPQSASSAALMTASLRVLRECVRDINVARLTTEADIELLNEVADFALAHVREARERLRLVEAKIAHLA